MIKKRGKYNNIPVEFDGYKFDSKGECSRYRQLKKMMEDGLICDLSVHPKIDLKAKYPSGRTMYYEADFFYQDLRNMEDVWEDFKGVETDVFKVKRALVKYFYNIDVVVVK